MKKVLFGLMVLILLMGTVAACSAKQIVKTVPAPTTQTSYALNHAAGYDSSGPVPMVTPTVTVPPTTITAGKGAESYNAIPAASVDRMVIRNGYLTLVVDDVSIALSNITALAAANGGFVINSNIQEDQNRLYANITFRVDSAKFNDTLQTLRSMAVDVKSESTSGEDVTSQYVDLTSSLRNLEASETQLLALMEKAGKVDEILQVQRELTNTRGQIEQIKGQMQYLEQSSDLAMISASLEQSKLTVEFNASTRIVKVGEAVQFIPNIAGGISPYSYEWNFGDGSKSTEPNPAHTYSKTGTFTVSVKITDDKGNTDDYTRTDYVTVTVVPGWSAGNVASSAWHGLLSFFQVVLNIIIWLGILSPIWIAILVILYFTVWRRRKNRANKAK